MSIFSKLFKKKDDDFSLDGDFGSDSSSDFSSSFDNPGSSPDPNNLFGNSSPDQSFNSSFDVPNTTGMPTQQHSPMPPPLDDPNTIAPTRGSQMARDYMARQQGTTQPSESSSNNSSKDHTLEMINLKLDAIKSQLEILNQRLEKVEEKKKLW